MTLMIFSPLQTEANIIRWIDGDTVEVEAIRRQVTWPDVVNVSRRVMRLRLAVIDTPERGKPGFREATDYVNNLMPIGSTTSIILYSMERSGPRWVADVLTSLGGTETVSSLLLRDGHAKVWL